MNFISFANFTQPDNQTHLFPQIQKDERTEDFSAILQSIFTAIQPTNLPAPNLSSGFEQNILQVQTVSENGQNFVVSNNQFFAENSFNQSPVLLPNPGGNVSFNLVQTPEYSSETNSLPTFETETATPFSPAENLISIPTNFQSAPKLPTMQNFFAENPRNENSSEIPQTVSLNIQPLDFKSPVNTKDFEILTETEKYSAPSPQNFFDFTPIKAESTVNLPQIFQNVRDKILENDSPVEITANSDLTERDFVKTEVNLIENQKIDSPILKAETTVKIIKPQIQETVIEAKVSPDIPLMSPNISENSAPKSLPNLNVKSSVDLVVESSINVKLPKQPNEVNPIKVSVVEMNLTKIEAQPVVEVEINSESNPQSEIILQPQINGTKLPINFDSTSEINMIPETKVVETKLPVNFVSKTEPNLIAEPQINKAKLPVDLKIKTDSILEAQSNLEFKNAPNLDISTPSHTPTEFVENLNISSKTEPIFSEIKAETKPTPLIFQNADLQFAETIPSQPISLNVDSQVVESANVDSQVVETTKVKPQVENAFIDKITQPNLGNILSNEPLQPKLENTFVEEMPKPNVAFETPKPNLAETPKPILTDDDFIGVKLPFEDSSAPVSVENKPLIIDKTIQSDVVEKPSNTSSEESVKPNLAAKKSTEVKPHIDALHVFENINLAETKVVKPKLANYLNDGKTIEKNLIQPNILPENQKLNQSPNLISNETTQTEKAIKVTNLETSQDFNFNEKPAKETKPNEAENNLPVNFDKLVENASKDSKIVETNLKNQIEPTKIAEQINPHLLELAALVEKKDEKEILKLRLHPAELGTVEITLERDKSGVLNAHFKTETEGAQQILSNTLEQLRDNLQNAGWEVGQLEITNGSSSSTTNQDRENTQRKSEWIENFVFSRSSEKPDEAENSSPKRLLNLLA